MTRLSRLLTAIVICAVFGGAIHYDFRNDTQAKNQPTKLIAKQHQLQLQNRLAKRAIDKIGESDSGDAEVEYIKHNHQLKFILLDMDDLDEFKDDLVNKQTKRFKRISHLHTVYPTLIVSHRARVRKAIELREQAQQRHQNIINARKARAKQAKRERTRKIEQLVKQSRRHKQHHNSHNNKHKSNNSHHHNNRRHK